MDENYNPMPAGTALSIDTNSNVTWTDTTAKTSSSATITVLGSPVPNTIHAGGTPITIIVDGGSACTSAVAAGDTIDYPTGTVMLDLTLPLQNVVPTLIITIN
jgi:hypothetical protein